MVKNISFFSIVGVTFWRYCIITVPIPVAQSITVVCRRTSCGIVLMRSSILNTQKKGKTTKEKAFKKG